MLKFYDIDENYVKYLQTIDGQIPNIGYLSNNKFVCGVVLSINNFNYFAPISSNIKMYRTSLPIFDKQKIIATIRFCFMFPALTSVLTEKNFKLIKNDDSKYADLLIKEYNYCSLNEDKILNKARSVYEIGCNKNHKFNYTCCDFKNLEQNMDGYFEYITRKEIAVSKE
jgi:protein AbiQ